MLNRFERCKTLKDLYNVFANEEGVQEFNNLSVEELDRVAIVFEANIPNMVAMPDVPLTEAGYAYVWNVTVEEIETEPIVEENMEENVMNETINNATVNDNMEDETMKNINEETAATTEEVAMGEKAKEFAENAKEKLSNGFKFVTENVEAAADEVKKMANMNDAQLEDYLKDNGKDIMDKIIDAVKKYSGKMKDNADLFPSLNERADKADSIVKLIEAVLDKEELSGWGKFKAIVKELIKWLLRLLVKVGAIVLKLAFTLAVGAIKIGATAIVTTGKVIGVANKEVVKPTVKVGKNIWNKHQENKAVRAERAAKEAKENEFAEVREALFGVDENEEA